MLEAMETPAWIVAAPALRVLAINTAACRLLSLEEEQLRDMRADVVQQVMRRLAAVRP